MTEKLTGKLASQNQPGPSEQEVFDPFMPVEPVLLKKLTTDTADRNEKSFFQKIAKLAKK